MISLLQLKVGDFISVGYASQVCVDTLTEYHARDGKPSMYQINNRAFYYPDGRFMGAPNGYSLHDITSVSPVPIPDGVVS